MMGFLRDRIDRFFGGGSASTSVPVMDGPLQPNNRIEAAVSLARAEGLDNLTLIGGVVHLTSGKSLLQINRQHDLQPFAEFDGPISCLAASGDGALAVGIDGTGVVIRGGRHDGYRITSLGSDDFLCPSAALFLGEDRLVLASGSRRELASRWKHDLMSLGRSGSLWLVDLASKSIACLADGLAFPYGLAPTPEGGLVYTEAWRHRLSVMGLDGAQPREVLGNLPGYPGRIVSSTSGGYWLGIFAPRNQLVEFVLREPGYRSRMILEVDPDLWIAPSLASNLSFREPLQGGGVKQMGILKPWAPIRSFGLVVRLDREFRPIESYHSRADGHRHGITSLCENSGQLFVGAKGKGEAVALDISSRAAREDG